MTAVIWLSIGLFIGANLGVLAMALCTLAKDADEPRTSQRKETGNDQPHGEVVIVHRPNIA